MKRRPVYAHSKAWQRLDDSLVELTDSRLNVILDEQDSAYDWTAQVVADTTIDDLDHDAIMLAREGYKQRYPKFAKECDSWSDKVFLDKACLTIDGKITKATLLLVGKEEKHINSITLRRLYGNVFKTDKPLVTSTLYHSYEPRVSC